MITQVAVGIIYNDKHEILIAQRPMDKHMGGLWEFPGGKVEAHETILEALKRELLEEVNIHVITAEPLTIVRFSYPEKLVQLDAWHVTHFIGQAEGKEGQAIRWVNKDELKNYPFPPANQGIFQFI